MVKVLEFARHVEKKVDEKGLSYVLMRGVE